MNVLDILQEMEDYGDPVATMSSINDFDLNLLDSDANNIILQQTEQHDDSDISSLKSDHSVQDSANVTY